MIHINYRDPRPIYEQIKAGYRKLIATGVLEPNEKIQSVRELASTLAINPNTIQRAYRELEAEGLIYSAQGRGSFVSETVRVDEKRKDELLSQFDITVQELSYLNVTPDDLVKRLTALYQKTEKLS